MRVHLIRHGEVENPDGLRYGRRRGFSLSEHGAAEVTRMAEWLVARFEIGAVLTSPLERAIETANIVTEKAGIEPASIDERLTEAGDWREGLPRAFAPRHVVGRLFTPSEWVSPENPRAVIARTKAAVLDAMAAHRASGRSGDLAIVTHQTPIRLARLAFERGLGTALAPRLVAWIPLAFSAYPCATASVTTLHFEGTECRGSAYVAAGRSAGDRDARA